jgi:hypothetical protein
VILRLGQHLSGSADLVYLLGFLAGRLDRVHFVRDLEGAPVALRFAFGRRRVWPAVPFQGVIRGVPVPAPAFVVSALLESDDDIFVRVDAEEITESPGYSEIVLPSYQAVVGGGASLQERVANLRARIDQTLDIYRACREVLATGDPERQGEIRFFLNLAQREIEALSRQLQAVQSEAEGERT